MKKRISFCLDHSIPYLLSDRIRIRSPFHPHIIDINDCLPEQEPSNFKSSTPPTQKGARGYTYYCSKIALEQYPYKYEASYARIIPHHVSFLPESYYRHVTLFLPPLTSSIQLSIVTIFFGPPPPLMSRSPPRETLLVHSITLSIYYSTSFLDSTPPCHAMPCRACFILSISRLCDD